MPIRKQGYINGIENTGMTWLMMNVNGIQYLSLISSLWPKYAMQKHKKQLFKNQKSENQYRSDSSPNIDMLSQPPDIIRIVSIIIHFIPPHAKHGYIS
jgi:hypothetical protein